MNRSCRVAVCFSLLVLPILAVAWSSEQDKKAAQPKEKKEKSKAIVFISPTPGQDATNDAAPATTFTANGTNDANNSVYGILFDPDSPDTPIQGTTGAGPGADGSTGPWTVQFAALPVKIGYLLRVIDSSTGTSQDCVFNIVAAAGTTTGVVTIGNMELCAGQPITVNNERVTPKLLRIRANVKAFKPGFVHGELLDPVTKNKIVKLGKTYQRHDKAGGDGTEAVIEFDVSTGITPGVTYNVRISSFLPHGHKESTWKAP